jgi:glycosyltransferase involved in cell wall biosynthesis
VKNTELAVRALSHLSDAELDILGDGPERQTLERLVRELDLDDRVRFHGFVPDVAPHLDATAILVHPSHAETFCLAAFEAAMSGVPVVCLDQGSLADTVPHYVPGVKVSREADPGAFAAGIDRARSMVGDRCLFAAAEERRRSDLSQAAIGEAWTELLGRLVSRG